MKIINKGRGQGKTWDLIKEASCDGTGVILVCDNYQKLFTISRTREMYGIGAISRLPEVITVEELKNGRGKRFYGLSKHEVTWYLDELEQILNYVLDIGVNVATMTGEIEDHTKSKSSKSNSITVNVELNTEELDSKLKEISEKFKAVSDILS